MRISTNTSILSNTMPTADAVKILAECGFISNPEEEKKLNDEDYRSRLAWAIASAAEEFCSDDKGKSI